jgi:hypothetical protein
LTAGGIVTITAQTPRLLFSIALVLVVVSGCGPYKTSVLSHHFVSEDAPHGVLTTASKKIFVDRIDGISTENVNQRLWVVTHSADEYRLTPGKHIIICSYRKHLFNTKGNLPLDLYIEPGYSYVLDVVQSPDTASGWQAVIKSVEPLEPNN